MATTQAPHDPAATQQPTNAPAPNNAAPSSGTEVPSSLPLGIGQEQVMAILKHLPGVFGRVSCSFYWTITWFWAFLYHYLD